MIKFDVRQAFDEKLIPRLIVKIAGNDSKRGNLRFRPGEEENAKNFKNSKTVTDTWNAEGTAKNSSLAGTGCAQPVFCGTRRKRSSYPAKAIAVRVQTFAVKS